MKNLLINIHGFLSSHESEKVLAFRQSVNRFSADTEFLSPRLPNKPAAAVALIEDLIASRTRSCKSIALIGHSLGGYYATYIASKHDLKACLVNPVVRGYEIMCEFYGACYNPHTNEHFDIGAGDIEYLVSLHVEHIADKSRFLVMLQLGDEIVDPEVALAYYQGCATVVEEGGCHDFSGFAHHAASILRFLYGH